VPTLVIHGLDDRLVPPRASSGLGELPNVERRLYPGLRHELHNEPEGRQIVGEVIEWLRSQVERRSTAGAASSVASVVTSGG
jgi:alpha-beta hydrolase superfamily lysophospholipase